jgi:hypothetical protein
VFHEAQRGKKLRVLSNGKKMLSILREESSKVETLFLFFLKCKDEYRIDDLLVQNGHVKNHQKLVDDEMLSSWNHNLH